MSELEVLLVLVATAFAGAFVQGCIGFGVGVVAAPVVTLLDPSLMPGAVLIIGASFALATTVHDWRSVDWHGVRYALVGRLPGMVAGVAVVAMMPVSVLEMVVALSVLGAALVNSQSSHVRRTRVSLLAAGAASGFTGTAAGIGGPPMALLYGREPGPILRGTLGAFFLTGSIGSLLLLAWAQEVGRNAATAGLIMLPPLALGFLLATRVRKRISAVRLRQSVLGLVIVSALVLLVRAAL